ncbi:hypothetical protein HMPREF1014_05526, partial [Bacillus sp. 7_6_55CFAA_CT2]
GMMNVNVVFKQQELGRKAAYLHQVSRER